MPERSAGGRPRARRAAPDRTAPRRQSTTGTTPSPGTTERVEQLLGDSWRTAQKVVEAATEPMLGAAERGVHTAYSLIDEYVARGREAARRHDSSPPGARPMNDRPAGPPNPFDTVAGPMGAMMGPWLQMMRVWGDAMNTMAPGMGAAAWGMPWAVATSREVSVLVSAAVPVEVRAQVQCGDGARLTLEPLSREGGGAPAIASVAIAPVEQHIRVSVTIPNDQPAGRYRGTVRDGTGRGCGSVTVDIGAGRPQA